MKALYEYSWPGNVRELENVIERLVVTVQGRRSSSTTCRPKSACRATWPSAAARAAPHGGRRAVQAHDRAARVVLDDRVSAVHGSRDHALQRARSDSPRLEEARGNYKIVARLFNMETRDYKRFLNFLRKHDCQIPFKEYR
jgi:DNA-binding NtrC family response regulator